MSTGTPTISFLSKAPLSATPPASRQDDHRSYLYGSIAARYQELVTMHRAAAEYADAKESTEHHALAKAADEQRARWRKLQDDTRGVGT